MKLEEIRRNAAEKRVKTLKTNAKAAKDRVRQLNAQADISADRLDMRGRRATLI